MLGPWPQVLVRRCDQDVAQLVASRIDCSLRWLCRLGILGQPRSMGTNRTNQPLGGWRKTRKTETKHIVLEEVCLILLKILMCRNPTAELVGILSQHGKSFAIKSWFVREDSSLRWTETQKRSSLSPWRWQTRSLQEKGAMVLRRFIPKVQSCLESEGLVLIL